MICLKLPYKLSFLSLRSIVEIKQLDDSDKFCYNEPTYITFQIHINAENYNKIFDKLSRKLMGKRNTQLTSEPSKVQKKQKITKPKKYVKTFDAIDRIQKSKHQRIFLLKAERAQDHWDFTVQGTKGTDYFVMTSQTVKCTCMDFKMKKKPCKHIYFIVTQVAQNQQILDYFRNSNSISKAAYKVLDEQLQKRLKSRLQAMKESDKKDIDLKDDTDCVICFSQMDKDQQKLTDCGTCKKYFHSQCIQRWVQHNPSCPLCRGQLKGSGNNPLDKLQSIVV